MVKNTAVFVAVMLLWVALGGGCATVENTQAQQIAWQAWDICKHFTPGAAVHHVTPEGEIFVQFRGDRMTWANAGDRDGLVRCLRAEFGKLRGNRQ